MNPILIFLLVLSSILFGPVILGIIFWIYLLSIGLILIGLESATFKFAVIMTYTIGLIYLAYRYILKPLFKTAPIASSPVLPPS